ncbi:MAG: GtrA family protein [Paludibacteraceae bacterium]
MRTWTGRLPQKYRSMVRFVIVGTLGTAMQYGIYYAFLALFERYCPNLHAYVTIAFTIGFCVEMVSNYLLTSFYTFRSRPCWKNASGFLVGRAVNYVVQIGFLHLLILCTMSEEWAGIVAIALAGIVNYFVLLPFYRKQKRSNI